MVHSAAFWTAAKPCDEALADLAEAYNALADRHEDLLAELDRERAARAKAEETLGHFAQLSNPPRDYTAHDVCELVRKMASAASGVPGDDA